MIRWLEKKRWLVVILAGAMVLRIPSLFEPYWYGDEGVYLTIGQALRQGVKLYSEIHDNKPPFLYWIAAAANGEQFWFKLTGGLWNLVTIVVFYKLAQKILGKGVKKATWATAIFAFLTTVPLFEGNIANAELFFLLPTIAAAYVLWDKDVTWGGVFVGGVIYGLGGLFKAPAVLEAGVWPVVWLATRDKEWIKKTIILAAGVVGPLVGSGIYFASQGVGDEYLRAALGQNIPYLSSWTGQEAGGIFSLKGRTMVVAIILAVVAGWSQRIGRAGTTAGVWGSITLFAALLSGRPYPHYLLQTTGAVVVLAMMLWRGEKMSERWVSGGLIVLIAGAFAAFKFYLYPAAGYYGNFVSWVGGQKSREAYFGWFDAKVNTNYEVAAVVGMDERAGEKMFVWGDEPMVYALAGKLPVGRYTVAYHIKDFGAQKETVEAIRRSWPKYIVSYGREEELPGLGELLAQRYLLYRKVGTASIYRLSGLSLKWL